MIYIIIVCLCMELCTLDVNNGVNDLEAPFDYDHHAAATDTYPTQKH